MTVEERVCNWETKNRKEKDRGQKRSQDKMEEPGWWLQLRRFVCAVGKKEGNQRGVMGEGDMQKEDQREWKANNLYVQQKISEIK